MTVTIEYQICRRWIESKNICQNAVPEYIGYDSIRVANAAVRGACAYASIYVLLCGCVRLSESSVNMEEIEFRLVLENH